MARPIYVMSNVAKLFAQPTKTHCATDKCILKYLKGIWHLVICSKSSSMTHSLTAYYDTNYVANLDYKKSRSSYMLFLNNGLMSWVNRNQTCIVGLTIEFEYIVNFVTTKEVVWIHCLLYCLRHSQLNPTLLLLDNQRYICLAYSPKFPRCTKHINI
jgi:hypothetical protein